MERIYHCGQQKFRSTGVKYMAVELIDGHVILLLAGIFGWSGWPAASAMIHLRAALHVT